MRRSSLMSSLTCVVPAAMLVCCLAAAPAAAAPDREAALEAMRRAARFMVEEVSCHGGYVWNYTPDLSRRWGEAPARESQIWVQGGGGTPAMGNAYLDCWEATGDPYFLECAKQAANALIYGQHPLGGWHYFIEFDKPGLDPWYRDVFSNFKWGMEEFRHYYGNCTYDDGVTTGATRFLMRLYLATLDPAYKQALDKALDFIRMSQYPSGGWPQRYPLRYEFAHDGLPDYTACYTLNDSAMSNIIELLVEAYELLGDERNMEAARRGMDFLIVLQGPPEQPGWSDQHGMDLKPAWGRTHEHVGYMPRYTIQAIRTLEDAWLATGDRRYLQPIPAALDWLERSAVEVLADGNIRVAKRYEVGTNRPIQMVRTDQVNEEGYGIWRWETGSEDGSRINIEALRREYEELAALTPEDARARHEREREPLRYTPRTADPAAAERVIQELDERGAWVGEIRVFSMDVTTPSPPGVKWDNWDRAEGDDHATHRIQGISTSQFQRNMRLLADYVAHAE